MPTKQKTVTIKITNCKQCPHLKFVSSPSTGDSFDAADEDAICTLSKGTVTGRYGEKEKGKAIWVSERWWKPEHTLVPKWCPLTIKK